MSTIDVMAGVPKWRTPSLVSLRDYFAAHALATLCHTFYAAADDPDVAQSSLHAMTARSAYAIADAMLAERDRPKGE